MIDKELRWDLRDLLDQMNMKYEIMGRSKQLYSIYKKMVLQNKQLDEIFDLIAVRIIVESVRDCYAVLGQVHTMWKPLPGRFKDYIAMPKANMYQSLHTTVLGEGAEPFEIQIRTYEMHHVAEYGIAAHWKYKEGDTTGLENKEDMKLAWLRQTLEWQKELKDPKEFMETLKVDLFSSQVFVFTPNGDVIDLPAGSTPLDFAFKIHTDVGCRCHDGGFCYYTTERSGSDSANGSCAGKERPEQDFDYCTRSRARNWYYRRRDRYDEFWWQED